MSDQDTGSAPQDAESGRTVETSPNNPREAQPGAVEPPDSTDPGTQAGGGQHGG